MRIQGALKSWNAERGFGVIESAQGGEEVFVHLKAFRRAPQAPQIGQRLSFEVSVTWEGQRRARHVRLLRGGSGNAEDGSWPSARGHLAFIALPAFLALYLVVDFHWGVPHWVAGLYGLASLACFAVYAFDKPTGNALRWRASHPALLVLGLVGGWPGATVAQQLLQQQAIPRAFRALFWASVALNVLGFVLLSSPAGMHWLQWLQRQWPAPAA